MHLEQFRKNLLEWTISCPLNSKIRLGNEQDQSAMPDRFYNIDISNAVVNFWVDVQCDRTFSIARWVDFMGPRITCAETLITAFKNCLYSESTNSHGALEPQNDWINSWKGVFTDSARKYNRSKSFSCCRITIWSFEPSKGDLFSCDAFVAKVKHWNSLLKRSIEFPEFCEDSNQRFSKSELFKNAWQWSGGWLKTVWSAASSFAPCFFW